MHRGNGRAGGHRDQRAEVARRHAVNPGCPSGRRVRPLAYPSRKFLPGKRITDHQVHKYQQHRNKLSQSASAAKSGISERSARRIEDASSLPSQRPKRHWRTREDPLSAVWDSEVVPLLQTDARLNAVTLLEELQRRQPGQWDDSVLRTLQRRMRLWRAKYGDEREIYFAQEHPPGRQGISDFTVADELGVQIAGVAFAHRLYQFALAYSGWRHVTVIDCGESFMALSTGLQAALWAFFLDIERCARRTPHRQPVSRLQQFGRTGRVDSSIRRPVPPLRAACNTLQPGPIQRERLYRSTQQHPEC